MSVVFTCACRLNSCYNGSGVEMLIAGIVDGLGLKQLEFATDLKNTFNTSLQNMFDFYLHKYGNESNIQKTVYASSSSASTNINMDLFNRLKSNVNKRARANNASSELGRYLGTNWIATITPEEFENFDILVWWKEREPQFPILAAMTRDLLSVQASTVASESAFFVSGRILSTRRTRLNPTSLEMTICLKNYLDAAERIQDKSSLEWELEVKEVIFDAEVAEGMIVPLNEKEEAMDEWMRNNSLEMLSETQSEPGN